MEKASNEIIQEACKVFNLKYTQLAIEVCRGLMLSDVAKEKALSIAQSFFKETSCYCQGFSSPKFVYIASIWLASLEMEERRTQYEVLEVWNECQKKPSMIEMYGELRPIGIHNYGNATLRKYHPKIVEVLKLDITI